MRSELKRALGAALKSYRLNRNLSQETLGASQAYISDLERGRASASLDKIEKISSVLGVHPASVILAGYLSTENETSSEELLERIRSELEQIGL